ncbi:MAG: Na/Pi cotransporter family protein [Hydrogenophaga sp.]|jgi:phosphate:Na+ symporter|uniref:Na/Pi cotransporter family protein n=1 Tax=Hydrogenophaga sp. TaxID=1904254 RepID=UPI0025C35878|nr:Na/Pi cotransporter family protein [Hydrogenophaga sp.]MDO9504665.1 Na/Pi cotransporter family protein [Hydrogenophaga sp.]MDP2251540.1 Na/Pi cotransporter family protein [Hydrogenophaga sp.]MDP2988015.1 Na/Pi cotransporter family protein [Hydrogenophaga sp.]MDP3203688.1 Na/Pi cotransporter family protein [Hydrogenophaga sp.]MDP3627547.1 Na/Pi cotransporter family protein [Hydrogenophaga sp.]
MKHLLDLLAAIALLVWGTHLVRNGVLRVFGSNLRQILAASMGNRFTAALSGLGVTALVQSSTATALITASFVGRGLIALPAALAVMLGADIGTSLMAVVFSFDLSWLSPLFIFLGVTLFISRQGTSAGDFGRVLIGLGLMLLALRLISSSTNVLTQNPAVQLMLESLTSDLLLEILLGATLAVVAYSSLAVVLLASTLALQVVGLDVALGIVLGANLGSGLLAVITTAKSGVSTRQVPLGNLLFKVFGVAIAIWLIPTWVRFMQPLVQDPATLTVLFHLSFNLMVGALFIGLTRPIAALVNRLLPLQADKGPLDRPNHLDPSALATPSLAISCAAREAMHQADVVETMLRGVVTVIKTNDLQLAKDLRKLDDTVDSLYSAIKYYLTKISRQQLSEAEGRRWTDIISFTINMEQIGDTVERVLLDIEDKKIRKGRDFSEAGMAEITELHARLLDNLRLGMSVFLNGNVRDAQRLLEEKVRFRDKERAYAATHLDRLSDMSQQSMDTSALHLDLISDLKRINSHICSIAYPILDSAGVLAPSRLREPPSADVSRL